MSLTRAQQRRSVGAVFLRTRPLCVAPFMVTSVILLWASGAPREQLIAQVTGFALAIGFFAFEAVRVRRRAITDRGLLGSLVVTQVFIGFGCALTGAASSPLLPMLLAPAGVTFAAFGRSHASLKALIAAGFVLLGLLMLPSGVPFAPIAQPWDGPMAVVATLAAASLLLLGVTGLSDAYAAGGEALARRRVGDTAVA